MLYGLIIMGLLLAVTMFFTYMNTRAIALILLKLAIDEHEKKEYRFLTINKDGLQEEVKVQI